MAQYDPPRNKRKKKRDGYLKIQRLKKDPYKQRVQPVAPKTVAVEGKTMQPCLKRIFSTKGATAKTIRHLERKGSVGLDAYFCQQCQGWHIGHKSKVEFL